MSFKISIKTPADINKEAVKSDQHETNIYLTNENDSENVVAEVEGDVVLAIKNSSQVPNATGDNNSRILSQLQPGLNAVESAKSKTQKNKIVMNQKPIPSSVENTVPPTFHIDVLTRPSMLGSFPDISSFNLNNISLESSNVGPDITDEPLPFIPKLIPIQSLSNPFVRKDIVDTPSAIVLEDTVLPNGWRKVVKERQSGRSAGSTDVYVFNPAGQRFRSRAELARYIDKTGDPSASLDMFNFARTKRKNFSSTVVVNNSRLDAQVNKNTPTQIQVTGSLEELVNLSANKDMNKELSDGSSSINDEDVERLLSQKMNALQENQINDSQDDLELHKPEHGYRAGQKRKFEIDLADFLDVQIEY